MLPLEAQIRVDSTTPGKWRVELDGVAGRQQQLVDPLTDKDLELVPNLVKEARTWEGLVARLSPNAWTISLPSLQRVGQIIRDRLFGWGEAPKWFSAMAAKATERGKLLRLVLDLDEDAQGLALIPIELAFDGTEFVFKRKREPMVRCDANVEWVAHTGLKRGDRVLVATAHSDVAPTPSRDELRAHAEAIVSAATSAGFVAEWMEDASPAKLEAVLTGGEPIDVLYIACHGMKDARCKDRLVLRGAAGDQSLEGDTLAKWTADQAERARPIKAVVLSACSSAAPAATQGTSGMAQWLLRRGRVHAAMGYRSPVGVTWALSFGERLFAAVGEDTALEEAFAAVRWGQSDSEPQWVLPLFFARRWDVTAPSRRSVGPESGAVHAAPGIPPSLVSLLPRGPRSYFTARTDELRQLQGWLRTPGSAVIRSVAGEGGVGKTELATYVAHGCHLRGVPVLWLEQPDRNLRGALLSLIRAAEPAFQPQPETTDSQLAVIARERLRPHRGLLVLDDVTSARDLDALQPGGGWSTLVTTRVSGLLSGVLEIPLRSLEPADALLLLSKIAWRADVPPPEEAKDAEDLVRELEGLPLAIELAGSVLWTEVISAAAYLADHRKRVGPAGAARDQVAAVLTRSLTALGDDARHTVQALAVLPRAGARLEMVARTLDVREPEAARRLDRLVRHHLATFVPETGLYRIHPRVREAAREEAADDETRWAELHRGAAEAMERLSAWVSAPLGTSSDRAGERWRSARNLFDSLDMSAWDKGAPGGDRIAMTLARADQFRSTEWAPDARGAALELAERLGREGSPERRARVLHARGNLRLRQADLAGAATDYNAALGLFQAVEDRHGQANALMARGDLHYFQDDHAGAATDYDTALGLFQAAEDRLGQANVLRARGDLRRFQADHAGAATDYDAALGLFQAVEDRIGQANVLMTYGYLEIDRGAIAVALSHYITARPIYAETGDALGLSNVLAAMAHAYFMLGDVTNARAAIAEGQPLADRSQNAYARKLLASVLAQLG